MIDWKQKLSSRKFWVLLAGLVTSIVLMVQGDTTVTTGGTILALGSIVAYLLGESWVDAKTAESNQTQIVATSTSSKVVEQALNPKAAGDE